MSGGINTYAYVGGNPVSYTDPLGLFITSVDAACIMDPQFCAEIMGQIVENLGALTCQEDEAAEVADGIRKVGVLASVFFLGGIVKDAARGLAAQQAKNLARFEKKLPAGAGPTAVRDLPGGGKAFQAEVPGRVPDSKAVYEKQVDANGADHWIHED